MSDGLSGNFFLVFSRERCKPTIALVNKNVIHLGDNDIFGTDATEPLRISLHPSGKLHSEGSLECYGRHNEYLCIVSTLLLRMEIYGIHQRTDKQPATTEMTESLLCLNLEATIYPNSFAWLSPNTCGNYSMTTSLK